MTFLDYEHELFTYEAKMEWQKTYTYDWLLHNFQFCSMYVYQEAKIPLNILLVAFIF